MGHLKEKYTKEYFTGKNEKGEDIGYGATMAYDNSGNLISREHDQNVLKRIDFKGKNVLDLGVGRGEAFCYAIEHGALNCVGVDFSESAIKIADNLIKNKKLSSPKFKLINDDALSFLKSYIDSKDRDKFDVIIMLDFVEHVPRAELKEIFQALKLVLNEQAVLVINTPAYKFDNDVIKDGLDERNLVNCLDTSDTNEATSGMHCNKYTVISLQLFMKECGYINVTEMHFFALDKNLPENFSKISYMERWELLRKNGYSINEEYSDDVIERPYSDTLNLNWKKFEEGNLSGISLYLTDGYALAAYENGNIDSQIFSDPLINDSSKNLVMFDVGAFMGADSFVFAKKMGKRGRVISFEPNAYNLNRLFLNLSHNPSLHGKVDILPYALGDMRGKIRMNISANIDNGHSSTSRISHAHSKIDNSLLPEGFFEADVDVITLDEFVEKNNIIPDIIKVDIEGAEHLMLAGSIKTIAKYKPIIYMEIHSEYCAVTCYKIFSDLNYAISIIHEEKDNRIMIKAIPEDNNKKVVVMSEVISNINDRIRNENSNLQAEKTKLQVENNNLQIKNSNLQAEKNQLLNSKTFRYSKKIQQFLKKIGIEKL